VRFSNFFVLIFFLNNNCSIRPSTTYCWQLYKQRKSRERLRACLQGGRVTLASGLPKHSHISSFFLRCVYKAVTATRVGGSPYLRARVTLAGRLTFSLVNTPGRVNPSTRVKLSTCFQTLGNRAH